MSFSRARGFAVCLSGLDLRCGRLHTVGAVGFSLDLQPVRLHFSLSFHKDLVGSWFDPMSLSGMHQLVCHFSRDLDPSWRPCGFHARRSVHGVTEQLESSTFTTQHTGSHRTAVQTDAHAEIGSIWSQHDFQPLRQDAHLRGTIATETCHNHSVILAWIWQPGDGDVAISDCFDFEHAPLLGDLIELMVNRFKQGEDLGRLTRTRPCRETDNIRKHDGCVL
mmetsp:Transcript_23157/g.64619  ORF Transcript_23157/g.64619 Transcript_23157/m.64619 type:complete len:221 (-) Transcript_23157:6-668(-)